MFFFTKATKFQNNSQRVLEISIEIFGFGFTIQNPMPEINWKVNSSVLPCVVSTQINWLMFILQKNNRITAKDDSLRNEC